MTSWNEIPYDPSTPDNEKGEQFDRQYAENKANGDAKEASNPRNRPEPGQADREPKGKW